MELSTHDLVLDADSAIDMQLHTTNSDGDWTPEQLVDNLVGEHFGMVAITDHDRVDRTAAIQALAIEKGLPILVATEFSANWRGQAVDTLCFGFDPDNAALKAIAATIRQLQDANTRQAYDYLLKKGYRFEGQPDPLQTILDMPTSRQPHALIALLSSVSEDKAEASVWKVLAEGGAKFMTNPIADVVDAVHQGGGVCLIAHPGRGQFWPIFDPPMLDEIRSDVPLDGFEAYYPLHSEAQKAMFVEYARQHDLLTSAGSDSHGKNRNPIKYPAHNSRKLLERLGVQVRA